MAEDLEDKKGRLTASPRTFHTTQKLLAYFMNSVGLIDLSSEKMTAVTHSQAAEIAENMERPRSTDKTVLRHLNDAAMTAWQARGKTTRGRPFITASKHIGSSTKLGGLLKYEGIRPMLTADFIDVALPDPELDEIAAIEPPRNRAIALNRYPGLDPRNATVTKMAAVLTEELIGEWGRMLHDHLACLAKLDVKALEKLQKKLRKAPVSPLNLWIDFSEEEPPIVYAAAATGAVVVEINEAATPELV